MHRWSKNTKGKHIFVFLFLFNFDRYGSFGVWTIASGGRRFYNKEKAVKVFEIKYCNYVYAHQFLVKWLQVESSHFEMFMGALVLRKKPHHGYQA